MKKRQILTGVMALLMSAALCACGGGKTAESTSAEGQAATEAPEASAEESSNTLSDKWFHDHYLITNYLYKKPP